MELTEKQLDDLQWAKDFMNGYERKYKPRKLQRKKT